MEPAPVSLRILTAALTAWCAFWATLAAPMTVMSWLVVGFGLSIQEPNRLTGSIGLGLLGVLGLILAIALTRIQWRGMRTATSGEHAVLLIGLIVVGIAVSPAPFVYTQF